MKSLLRLHLTVIQDMGDLLDVNTARDQQTLISRFHGEGDQFLTTTLPKFEDGLLASIENGNIAPSSFPSFRFRRGLPVFLQGFLERIFSRRDGTLLTDVDAEAVRAVRQVTSLSKKLEVEFTPRQLRVSQEAYVGTDQQLAVVDGLPEGDSFLTELSRTVHELYRNVIPQVEKDIFSFSLVPRHGPGSVAEGFTSSQKWDFNEWIDSLESVFPSIHYTSYNGARSPIRRQARDEDKPVKVIFVPKTAKGPRVIAIEPTARQYVQQAISRPLYRLLAKELPAAIDLSDQRTNRALAWLGSIDRSVSTLDLSEASDRLSLRVIREAFSRFPVFQEALEAARSPYAVLPDGEMILLRKYASMGSALTFPLQSMVFLAIAVMAVSRAEGAPVTLSSLKKRSDIAVFGDDIIVPTSAFALVTTYLEAFGLKVNVRKSFSKGNFRESCGEEYLHGCDVSIARYRKPLPTSVRDVQQYAATMSFRNDCYIRGMWKTVKYLDKVLLGVIAHKHVPVGYPGISPWTLLPIRADRFHRTLFKEQIRRPQLVPVATPVCVDGTPGITKWFFESTNRRVGLLPEPSVSATERPVALAIHNRWSDLDLAKSTTVDLPSFGWTGT